MATAAHLQNRYFLAPVEAVWFLLTSPRRASAADHKLPENPQLLRNAVVPLHFTASLSPECKLRKLAIPLVSGRLWPPRSTVSVYCTKVQPLETCQLVISS